MTTRLLDKEIPVQGVSDPLAAKMARNSFMDTLRATPRKARAWVASTLRTLHIDAAASTVVDAARWAWARVLRAARFVKGFGLANLAGSVLSTPSLRRGAVSLAAQAYGVVRKPFEWIGRGLSWAFGKVGFGFGQRMLADGVARGARLEAFVASKIEAGLTWLDQRQSTTGMQALQGLAYGGLVAHAIRLAFPTVNASFRLAANLVSGAAWGYRTYRATRSEDKAIAAAKVVLADPKYVAGKALLTDAAKASAPTAAPLVPATPSHHMRAVTFVLTDTDRPDNDRTVEAAGFIDDMGQRYIRSEAGGLTHVDDLPETVTIVGEHQGEVLLPPTASTPPRAAARALASSSSGRPAKKATHRKR